MAGEYVADGRALAAGRGWDWIGEAWALFKKQPGVWIGIVVIMAVIYIVAALVPVIGSIASLVFGPVFAAGFVIGARAQDQGGELQIGHLFAGFRERFGPLALVGVLYLVATAAIMGVVMLAVGVSLFTSLGDGRLESMPPAAVFTLLIAMLIMAALMIPVLMAIWFAPALVVFHGKDAVQAMKESFFGCLKNIAPFFVYGLVMLVFGILASIPFGLGWLVLGPVLAASVYTAYKDVFIAA